jgi:pseudouridine-5'-phosphate glycosidase
MLKINPEVLSAIKENRPVVALESTIISHGMPYPKNVQTILDLNSLAVESGKQGLIDLDSEEGEGK